LTDLQNKNILLFIPSGKGIYGTAISEEIEGRGARVYVYDERPSANAYSKLAFRIAKNQLQPYFLSYLQKIFSRHKDVKFDFLLIVRGEAFTPGAMKLLKNNYSEAKFLLYLWDSINYTDTRKIIPFFDKVFSFDSEDASRNQRIIHRPLFYINDYKKIATAEPGEIDLTFIGKVHSDRYKFLKEVNRESNKLQLKTFFYLYFPSKANYYLKRIADPAFSDTRVSDFKFKMLKSKEVANYISESKACLDSQHPSQSGLTMRTIEVLGANRKMITTNQYVRYYDFFRESNIQIVDINKPIIDLQFISSPFEKIASEIYEKYSLSSWINEIFA